MNDGSRGMLTHDKLYDRNKYYGLMQNLWMPDMYIVSGFIKEDVPE